ncbi:MAG: VTT domain-containing protein [Betaproteobacteria bacterium]
MTLEDFRWITDEKALMALLAAHETQGLLLVAAVIFCETGLVILPFLPGDSILFALGAFAGLNGRSPLLPIAALATAAIVGDGVNYLLGRSRVGQWIVHKGWVGEARMRQTRDYFDRFGPSTVTIGRFVPIVRTIAPFVAGLTQMPAPRFFLFNIVGGLAWTGAMILGGFWLGRIAWVGEHLSLLSVAIVAVSVIPVGVQWWRARRTPA